jgi:hypothetical protein
MTVDISWPDGTFNALTSNAPGSFSRRAEEIDNFLLQANPTHSSQIELAQDPTLVHHLQKNNLATPSDIKFGRIQMLLPHANWYRVALDDAFGELPCARLSPAGGGKMLGARDVSMLAADTKVAVLIPKGATYGLIVGVIPDLIEDGNHTFSDWVSQGSNAGLLRERYYTEYLRLLDDEGGAQMRSSGMPLDALSSDWIQTTETGLGFHLDSFMVYMRVDEECGITGFYHDRLLRIAGFNYDCWTACRVEEDRNDEGENYTFKGETAYPWEMLGCYSFDHNTTQEISDSAVLHTDPYAKLEPSVANAQPFLRYQEYGGYLGQAKIRLVVIPPDGKADSSAVRTYADTAQDIGVFREQISMDGFYGLESAKGIVLAKRSVIPAPKRVRPSDDYSSDCDSAENNNYKFAGLHGDSAKHAIGDLVNTEEYGSVFTAAAILDYNSYAFNWKGLHPFHYHEKDFNLPEESDSILVNQYLPAFEELADYTWLTTPKAKELTVDHRFGKVKFWELMQHISLTEDGAVVIQAGQGEEIRLSGGGIQISAPGRILIQSGNTTAILAGDDFIAKAYNSADITATNKDVRIKGEVNTMLLAGNSGTGTLLLENRATTTTQEFPEEGGEKIKGSGIILKAKQQIAAIAPEIYLKATSGGQITLDGNNGRANVYILANNINSVVRNEITDTFGLPEPRSVNIYRQTETILGSSVKIDGQAIVNGTGLFRNSVLTTRGSFSSVNGGQIGRLLNQAELDAEVSTVQEEKYNKLEQKQEDYQTNIQEKYLAENKLGNSDMQRKISYSLRPEAQCGTTNFVLPQNYWQTLNESVQAGTSWQENNVLYQESVPQQPWPGRRAWSVDTTYLTLPPEQLKFYDIAKGIAVDRTSPAYETRELGRFSREIPSNKYTIIPSSE